MRGDVIQRKDSRWRFFFTNENSRVYKVLTLKALVWSRMLARECPASYLKAVDI